jgi:soluble lytic murein transglycosylase
LNVFYKMQEAGEYRLPMILSIKLSDKNSMHEIQYPLAHWEIINEAAAKHNIDPFIVISLMREESRFDSEARSSVGAAGLMQLMPQTAYNTGKKLNMKITSLWQIYDVKTNINLGSYYINGLMKEFNSLHLAAAAYNAGEENVRKWQKAGSYKSSDEFIEDIPFDETRNFVKRVITTYFEYLKTSGRKNNMPKIL